MDWGLYLCRGCSPELLLDAVSREETESPVIKKLGNAFVKMGLSRFSSKIATEFARRNINSSNGRAQFSRAFNYLLTKLNNKHCRQSSSSSYNAQWQNGCPEIIEGLSGTPIWDNNKLPWTVALEEAFPAIRDEFLKQRDIRGLAFQPYRSPLSENDSKLAKDNMGELATDCGAWNVCYLHLHGLDFHDNLSTCPITAAAIKAIPRHYHHSFFSAIAPSTHITKHHGPTNKKLRCHLPLIVPRSSSSSSSSLSSSSACDRGDDQSQSQAWLRVADQRVLLEEGKCLVFDDSFEHETGNDGEGPRVVLIVDVWHPDLSDEEVKFFDYLNKCQMSAARQLSQALSKQSVSSNDFMSVIMAARRAAVSIPDEEVWGTRVIDD